MLVRRVIRDEIDDQADAEAFAARDELVEGRHPTEAGLNGVVVGNVITPIPVRRDGHWAEPEGVHAQPFQIVEPLDDATEVSDTVPVGVGKRADVDLVQDRALPPRLTAGGHGQRYRVADGPSAASGPAQRARRA